LIGTAVLTSAERQDFDLVNGDRILAGEGLLRTSAALQAIANKRTREMAARHSDYAGYDVAVDVRHAKLCTSDEREIEDQLQGGGGGIFSAIELNPRFTAFAVAIYTDASGTYEVEDYQAPCGLAKLKPPALPKASVSLAGLAVSVGAPAPGTSLSPLGSTITSSLACDPAAGLYAMIRYSGSRSGYFRGEAIPGNPIDQPAIPGTDGVLLATDLGAGRYSFGLDVDARIKLPDGDWVTLQLPGTGLGSKFAAVISPSC
jgi:hypothetical protein